MNAVQKKPATRVHREEARISVGPEHRGSPRFQVELDIHYGSEHNFYAGFIENISDGGVFVATYELKDVGDTVALAIYLPDRAMPVTGLGEVRWIRDTHQQNVSPGMGIRFVELDRGGAAAIEQFVRRREPMFYD